MANQKPEKKDKKRKREAILEASRQLIQEKSYDSITMEEIAAVVDISRPALYLYFKNKAEIYLSLLSASLHDLRSSYDRAISAGIEDSIGQLTAMAVAFFRFYTQNHSYFDLLVTKRDELLRESSEEIVEEFTKRGNAAVEPISSAYKRGIDDGIFEDRDPEKMAFFLRAVGIGIAVGFREGNLIFPDDIGLISDLVFQGINGKKEDSRTG